MFLQNASKRTKPRNNKQDIPFVTPLFASLLFDHENGDSTFLRNICELTRLENSKTNRLLFCLLGVHFNLGDGGDMFGRNVS
jgi:hypothetical protein